MSSSTTAREGSSAINENIVGSGNGVLRGLRFHKPFLTRSRSGRTSDSIGLDSLISSAKDRMSGNYKGNEQTVKSSQGQDIPAQQRWQ